jgi:hypothetical protein
MRRLALALVPWVALAAACGGLESPDLGTGTVRGRILGHLDGAYTYPVGRPDQKASVATDGTFTVEHVPVETHEIVLVDGPNAGIRRAVRAHVEIEGAGETTIEDRYGDAAAVDETQKMPLAGTVVAFARCEGGANPSSQRFTIIGTDQVSVSAGATGAAVMTPLPPGAAAIRGEVNGFLEAEIAVTVVSGASSYVAVPLSIDLDESAPGCAGSGGCANGLLCADDGACYECREDMDCATRVTGSVCDPVLHICSSAPSSGTGAICNSCSEDADCANVYRCASSDDAKYCTRTGCSSDLDCPAGFKCDSTVCKAPGGCAAYESAFGAPCWSDETCTSTLNSWATCQGVNVGVSPPQPGYCTAPCDPARADDCTVVDGFVCAPSSIMGLCQPQ